MKNTQCGAGLVGVNSILQAADALAVLPAPQGAAQAAPRNPSEGTAGVQQDTAVVQNGRLEHFPAWEALDQKKEAPACSRHLTCQ